MRVATDNVSLQNSSAFPHHKIFNHVKKTGNVRVVVDGWSDGHAWLSISFAQLNSTTYILFFFFFFLSQLLGLRPWWDTAFKIFIVERIDSSTFLSLSIVEPLSYWIANTQTLFVKRRRRKNTGTKTHTLRRLFARLWSARGYNRKRLPKMPRNETELGTILLVSMPLTT